MRRNISLLAGVVFLVGLVAALVLLTLKKTNGVFCYPLDDTFIHMAVAKNVALHGNWGINANEWVSTSSSPFFTALLAFFYKLTGLSVYTPLLLSLAGGILIVVAMQKELNRHTTLSIRNKILVIILTLLLGAVPSLSALGMEHTFQIAFTLFFVHHCASVFADNRSINSTIAAAIFGALMVITRYENAFLVASACGLLFLTGRFKSAVIIGFISALPIILFGLYAVSKGGLFIPNSIQIKVRQNYKQLLNGGSALLEVASSISGLILLAAFAIVNRFRKQQFDRSLWILSIFFFAALMHAVFGGFGWFYRYEAYLIVLACFHLLILAFEWMQVTGWKNRSFLAVSAIAILFTFNLPLRGMNALRNYIRSSYNIYEQQYQMGLFMKKYYNGKTIAANDIGAISYLADVNVVDLWGLGDNEVTRARKAGIWTPAFLQSLVQKKNASVAVVYESWFTPELLNHWQKTGTWEVSYSFMLGDTKVTFYAIDKNEAAQLKNNLVAFNAQLPKDIKVEYVQ
jgi:hypothetical protein